MDQHLIATWWERGYPVDAVLRAVQETGDRLKRRKRPPRGLPLTAMRKPVEKAGAQAAARRAASHHEPQASDDSSDILEVAEARAMEAMQSRPAADPSVAPLAIALREIRVARAERAPIEGFVTLLRVGRCYYDDLFAALAPAARGAVRAAVEEGLGDARARVAPAAWEQTVAELCRRALMDQDPVLDARRISEETP